MEQVLSSSEEEQKTKRNQANILILTRETIFISTCVLLSFLIRFFLSRNESVISWDGVYYASLGGKIISGDLMGGISAYWSPLYSFLIGITSIFFQDLEYSGKFISVIAGALLVIPSYFLIRDFYGQTPAFIGTILTVIHPYLINSSLWVMTESLYTLIFTTGILITWYALRDNKTRNFFLIGLLFGAAHLLKPEAIGFIGLIFVLMIGAKFLRRFQFRSLLKNYLALFLGFTIFFLPYVVFVHQKTGRLTVSQKLLINSVTADYGRDALGLSDDGQTTLKDLLFGDVYQMESQPTLVGSPVNSSKIDSSPVKWQLGRLWSNTVKNLKKQLKQYILEIFPFPQLFILLVFIGFFFQPWTRLRTAKEIYLSSFFICTLIGYALTVIEVRYLYPIIPILIAWISNSIAQFGHWASSTASNVLPIDRKINPLSIQLLTSLIVFATLIPPIFFRMNYKISEKHPFEEKQAGLWIKNQSISPSLIMAQSPIVAFYAGANHIFLPNENFSKVLEYAKRKKVNYLVVSEYRLKDTPKAFPEGEVNFPSDLKLIYKDERILTSKIFVYQLEN